MKENPMIQRENCSRIDRVESKENPCDQSKSINIFDLKRFLLI